MKKTYRVIKIPHSSDTIKIFTMEYGWRIFVNNKSGIRIKHLELIKNNKEKKL